MNATALPHLKFLEVASKNKLLLMRGTDTRKWTEKIVRGYALMVMEKASMLQCDSCHKLSIRLSSLYGYNAAEFHRHYLCADCLSLPSDYTIFEVKIKLHRKSSRNPSGIRTEFHVSRLSPFTKWMKKVVSIYPGSTAKAIYDNLYKHAEGNFEQSERLSYIMKRMWDFIPEIPFPPTKKRGE